MRRAAALGRHHRFSLRVAGLSYLYLKNQLFVLGTHRHAMEQELRDLIAQNNVLETRVSDLTSFKTLQHGLDDGFLKLIPIGEHAVAHVRNGRTRPLDRYRHRRRPTSSRPCRTTPAPGGEPRSDQASPERLTIKMPL